MPLTGTSAPGYWCDDVGWAWAGHMTSGRPAARAYVARHAPCAAGGARAPGWRLRRQDGRAALAAGRRMGASRLRFYPAVGAHLQNVAVEEDEQAADHHPTDADKRREQHARAAGTSHTEAGGGGAQLAAGAVALGQQSAAPAGSSASESGRGPMAPRSVLGAGPAPPSGARAPPVGTTRGCGRCRAYGSHFPGSPLTNACAALASCADGFLCSPGCRRRLPGIESSWSYIPSDDGCFLLPGLITTRYTLRSPPRRDSRRGSFGRPLSRRMAARHS